MSTLIRYLFIGSNGRAETFKAKANATPYVCYISFVGSNATADSAYLEFRAHVFRQLALLDSAVYRRLAAGAAQFSNLLRCHVHPFSSISQNSSIFSRTSSQRPMVLRHHLPVRCRLKRTDRFARNRSPGALAWDSHLFVAHPRLTCFHHTHTFRMLDVVQMSRCEGFHGPS